MTECEYDEAMRELEADPEYREYMDDRKSKDIDYLDDMYASMAPATMEDKQEHYVFVYGSLKTGFGNHRFLDGAKYLGKHETFTRTFCMTSMGSFPAVVMVNEGGCSIEGELYRVSTATLSSLDVLEGNGTFYTRRLIDVCSCKTGTTVKAWMYLLPEEKLEAHESVGCTLADRYVVQDNHTQSWQQR